MRILIIGNGGREHALAWKLAEDHKVTVSPGNPGTAQFATNVSVEAANLPQYAVSENFDLIVIGPENPLIDGLADRLRQAGLKVFGPGADGARLEGSKAFSKQLMLEAGIPTAQASIHTDPMDAKKAAAGFFHAGEQVVVKASGAALGKGVVVCDTLEQAEDAIDEMMVDSVFGDAGLTVVIEQRLHGPEFSLMTLCSGTDYFSLPVAQDYKRALDGDRGPNTGGMGSYSPLSWMTPELVHRTEKEVVVPVLKALKEKGINYRGVLFSGLMLHNSQPYCLEYNVRFGDPETQTLMHRVGTGLAEAFLACAKGEQIPPPKILDNAAVTVVVASGGYPGDYARGRSITITELEATIFHAGTALTEGHLVTAGGRVLAITASADNVESARQLAYKAVQNVQFEGMQYRKDIAANP